MRTAPCESAASAVADSACVASVAASAAASAGRGTLFAAAAADNVVDDALDAAEIADEAFLDELPDACLAAARIHSVVAAAVAVDHQSVVSVFQVSLVMVVSLVTVILLEKEVSPMVAMVARERALKPLDANWWWAMVEVHRHQASSKAYPLAGSRTVWQIVHSD